MKNRKMVYVLTGILIGAFLFGALPAIGASITAVLSSQPVTVDGKSVQVTVYNIDGSNYFRLRDLAEILDVGVWFDEGANTVRIESDRKYDSNYTGPAAADSGAPASTPAPSIPAESTPAVTEGTITITDYYDAGGKFSALGQALSADSSGDKSLTVKKDEIVIVGDNAYKVTADSLVLSFYTQPSRNELIKWWTEYMNDWLASGKVVSN